jgi:hypothetical protein
MSPTRASSYVVLVESGLVRKLDIPDPHLYSRLREVNAFGWLESKKTPLFTRELVHARTWQR